jgi:hypothetical protein
MKLKIFILDGKVLKNNYTLPTIIETKGSYALELGLTKLVEIYYGNRIKIELEQLLKVQLSPEEISRNFEIYLEGKHK